SVPCGRSPRQRACSPKRRGSALRVKVAERLQARVDVVGRVVVRPVLEAFAADRAEAGAVLAAERGNRFGQLDRLADGGLEVELVVVGQAERLLRPRVPGGWSDAGAVRTA